MSNISAVLSRTIDLNPITVLLLQHGTVVQPKGLVLLADESDRLLCDEQQTYLAE